MIGITGAIDRLFKRESSTRVEVIATRREGKLPRALKERLDSGNQALAALDFCHTSQRPDESVSDFIG